MQGWGKTKPRRAALAWTAEGGCHAIASLNDGLLLSVCFAQIIFSGVSMKFRGLVGWCVLVAMLAISAAAQPYNEAQFKGMKWRGIGPYRGGPLVAGAGIPRSPFTFSFGGGAGSVWPHTDRSLD